MIKKQIDKQNIKTIKMFSQYLFLRTKDAMVLRGAAALSYTTLLAIVPFMTVMLALFTVFPVFADVRLQMQDFLIQNLMPDTIQNIQNYLVDFISAAAKMTYIGAIGLLITTILMLSTIEDMFNYIFRVRKKRHLTKKAFSYFSIIIGTPIIFWVLLSVKGYLLTLQYFVQDSFFDLKLFLGTLFSNLMTFVVLTIFYKLIPNKKIHLINAFVGALVAFIAMYILRTGFGYFIVWNVTYKTIYGALASIPLILVWMYLWWTVVLSGAVLTDTLEEFKNIRQRLFSEN